MTYMKNYKDYVRLNASVTVDMKIVSELLCDMVQLEQQRNALLEALKAHTGAITMMAISDANYHSRKLISEIEATK